MDQLWIALTDFVRTRHGAITVAEGVSLGIPPYRLARWAAAGRLDRPGPGLYVVAGLPDSWLRRVRVATGSGAAWASHRTAAAMRPLDGFDQRTIEVVTPHGLRRRRRGWTVHESRTLRGVDLAVIDGIPVTALPRTILDLPAVSHPYLVAKALDQACRREPGMLDRIVQRHLELPRRGRRGARMMEEMLAERLALPGLGDSDFETAAIRLVRDVALPPRCCSTSSATATSSPTSTWPGPTSGGSSSATAWRTTRARAPHEWDRARRRQLKRLGWETTEVTYDDVTKRAARTGAELRELYHQRRAAVAALAAAGEWPVPPPTATRDERSGGDPAPLRH